MYQDKLAQLKKQLQQLKDSTLPDYMKKLKKIEQHYKERVWVNEVWYNYVVSNQVYSATRRGFVLTKSGTTML